MSKQLYIVSFLMIKFLYPMVSFGVSLICRKRLFPIKCQTVTCDCAVIVLYFCKLLYFSFVFCILLFSVCVLGCPNVW